MIGNTISILVPGEKRRLGMLILADIIISLADILSLALLLFIIDLYTRPTASTRFTFLPHWLIDPHSLWPITLFLILFSLKNLAGFLVYRAQSRFIGQVAGRISGQNLYRYLQGDFSAYVDIDSAVHIRSISHSPVDFCQHVLGGLQQIITQSVLILFAILAIVFFNAQLFLLLFLILLPPVVAVFYVVKKRLHAARIYAKASIEKALQHLQEAIAGFVESNVYDRNKDFLRRYIEWQQQFNHYAGDMMIVQGIPNRMIEIFALLGLFVLIAIYQYSSHSDHSAILTIGAFMAAAYKIIPGIVKILNAGGQISAWQYTVDELIALRKINAQPRPVPASSPIRSIRFNDVSFQYGDRPVLDKLQFSLQPGDLMGISGPSGRGKTTILHLLLGFLEPVAGTIDLNCQHAGANNRQAYWPQIAYVKQQPFLLHDTILYNITLSDQGHDEAKLQEALRVAGLMPLIASFPNGVQQVISENGKNISGGQRQRIAIARALYKQADLILLDEPFNELDEGSASCLLHHFRQMAAAGKMIIFITHHQQHLAACTKILSLDQ